MKVTTRQKDALVEFLNIGIGRAANALNQMVKEEIILSIPSIEFLHRLDVLNAFDKSAEGNVCAIGQDFESSFSGEAYLVFPKSQSLTLVQYVLGDLADEESMTELEQETMTEVGNVLLNACMSSLSDQMDLPINSSMPKFFSGKPKDIFFGNLSHQSDSGLVMYITVTFELSSGKVSGHILLVLDMHSSSIFLSYIDAFISKISVR